jgi:hypothetical protein
MGYVNTIGNNLTGAQFGFINTTIQQVQQGAQFGFVNTAIQEITGAQVGFVNTARQAASGIQAGFVNTTIKDFKGIQAGFVNAAMKESQSIQAGFVNVANRKENGLQLGFINIADSIGKAIPIGFLSFVRKGGYRALEYGFSEIFPVTVGFKTGVEKFYTSLYLAYKPSTSSAKNLYASGFGIGTIIPLSKSFFFNPELIGMNTIDIEWRNNRQLTSFVPNFGFNLNNTFSITAAPSVTWSRSYNDGELLKPAFNLANFEIDNKNSIFAGARINVRCRF